MDCFRNATTILTLATLSTMSLFSLLLPHTACAETETGDRPVIKVPRGGGRAAFEKFGCITCHLADGRGGQNEGGYGADLRVTKLSEQDVMQTISEGRTGKGMPSFKGMIDGETIEMLAKFIKEDLRLK
jgi:mono/diheme cytochrome c family protein